MKEGNNANVVGIPQRSWSRRSYRIVALGPNGIRLNVRVGSFASFPRSGMCVRFTPKNRHRQLDRPRPESVPSPDSCTATIFGLFDRLSGELRTSPSLTGVRAAALAGLAVTPLPSSAVVAGLRILGAEEGLPRLPDLEFAIYEKARPVKAAAALAAALLALARSPSRRRSEMSGIQPVERHSE